MSSAIGQVVAERWELLEVIGRGGHSRIFRARDLSGGPEVAVKMLHESVAGNQELTVRMVREYRAMETLAGTAAVRVMGLTTSSEGAMCLVMELLRGADLDDHLASLEAQNARLELSRLIELLDPIVATLELAHQHEIVHRDLKPGNIFVVGAAQGGGVRLLDFGLAKVKSEKPLTREDMIIGSPSYIAPEVWKGNASALDHRMDVYSLGAIVFRALAGRVPFEADTIRAKIELCTTAERPSLLALRPELPPEVDRWVAQALAVEPERRFFRIRGMWSAFRHAVGRPD